MSLCPRIFAALCFVVLSVIYALSQTAERFIVLEGTTASAHIFDSASNTELGSIGVGATPSAVVVAPNGRLAFVSNVNSEYVSVVDLTINAEVKRIHNVSAFYMAITSDGSLIVATDPRNEQVFVIDANAQILQNVISLNGFLGDDPNANDLGLDNLAVVGHKAYINTSDSIGVINLDTSSVAAVSTPLPAAVFSNGEDITATADGSYVLALRQGGTLVINPANDSVIQTLAVTGFSMSASGPASDPTRNYVYILANPGVPVFSILDMSTGSATFGQIIANAPLPPATPQGGTRIASSLDGSKAYVTCQTRTNPNVLVVDTNAAISNPNAAVIAQLQVGVQARGSVAALVQTQVSATAPVVTGVSTPLVNNDVANPITVQGSGFASGATVRIGTLDPVAAQFVSASALQITIPQSAPAEGPSIIVTNPDQESGILRGGFVIATPPAFQPVTQVGLTDFATRHLACSTWAPTSGWPRFFPRPLRRWELPSHLTEREPISKRLFRRPEWMSSTSQPAQRKRMSPSTVIRPAPPARFRASCWRRCSAPIIWSVMWFPGVRSRRPHLANSSMPWMRIQLQQPLTRSSKRYPLVHQTLPTRTVPWQSRPMAITPSSMNLRMSVPFCREI